MSTTITINAVESERCINSLLEHWAKAQIDGPMLAVARCDDVAKLLITIGGFVLGALAAVYSDMAKASGSSINMSQTNGSLVAFFAFMLAFFLFAALVCFFQPRMKAEKILQSKDNGKLSKEVTDWCKNIDRMLWWKRALLFFATMFFVVSFSIMMCLFLF